MMNYNKEINLELRQKASKAMAHFFRELKRNHGNLDLMAANNEESISVMSNYASLATGHKIVVRVTDLGIAVEIEVEVKVVKEMNFPEHLGIKKYNKFVRVYESEDSDAPCHEEHYKALDADFVKSLVAKRDTRSKYESDLPSMKRDLEMLLTRIRRNTATLVRKFGQECAEGIYTLAFNGKNPSWEGHSYYRIMVEDFGPSDYELRDINENYVQSNDIHDTRFLMEIYERVLEMTK